MKDLIDSFNSDTQLYKYYYQVFSLVTTDLNMLLKNKLQLYKNYHIGDSTIDNWPYWILEENIKLINVLNEEEDKERKKQEGEQSKQMGNFSPSSYMRSMSSMSNSFKK
jgi:hypothetical protein